MVKKKGRKLHIWPNSTMKSFLYEQTSVLTAMIRLRDVPQDQLNFNTSFTGTWRLNWGFEEQHPNTHSFVAQWGIDKEAWGLGWSGGLFAGTKNRLILLKSHLKDIPSISLIICWLTIFSSYTFWGRKQFGNNKRCHMSTIWNKITEVKMSEEDLEMKVGH